MRWIRSIWGESKALEPMEERVLSEVGRHLSEQARELMERQLASINKVQRFTDGREVNLYHMVRGKPVFQESLTFANKDPEIRLATVRIRTKESARAVRAEVWMAHGRIFSITFDSSPKSWAGDSVETISVRLWMDPMQVAGKVGGAPATPADVARLEAWLGGLSDDRVIVDAIAPPANAWVTQQLVMQDYSFPPQVVELFATTGGFRVGTCVVHGLSTIRTIVLEPGELIVLAEKQSADVLGMFRDRDQRIVRLGPDTEASESIGDDFRSSLRKFLVTD